MCRAGHRPLGTSGLGWGQGQGERGQRPGLGCIQTQQVRMLVGTCAPHRSRGAARLRVRRRQASRGAPVGPLTPHDALGVPPTPHWRLARLARPSIRLGIDEGGGARCGNGRFGVGWVGCGWCQLGGDGDPPVSARLSKTGGYGPARRGTGLRLRAPQCHAVSSTPCKLGRDWGLDTIHPQWGGVEDRWRHYGGRRVPAAHGACRCARHRATPHADRPRTADAPTTTGGCVTPITRCLHVRQSTQGTRGTTHGTRGDTQGTRGTTQGTRVACTSASRRGRTARAADRTARAGQPERPMLGPMWPGPPEGDRPNPQPVCQGVTHTRGG